MSCGVCLHDLTDARLLPCLHSFCRSCLDQLAVTAGPDNQLRCPSCRTPCCLPVDRGAAALPRDSTKAPEREKDGRCDVCWGEDSKKRPRQATVWCSECDIELCAKHVTDHVLQRCEHHIQPCDTAKKSDVGAPYSTTGRTQTHFQPCPDHAQPMMYFCKTCDTLVCGGCTAVGKHHLHTTVHVSNVTQRWKEKTASEVVKLRSRTAPRLETSITLVDNVSTRLSARARNVCGEIRAAAQRVIETALACEQQLIQEVDDIEDSRLKVLDKQADELKSHLDDVKNAVAFSDRLEDSKATDDEKLALLLALEGRARALNEAHDSDWPHQHARIGFRASSENPALKMVKECVGSISRSEACATKCTIKRHSILRSFVKEGKTAVFLLQAVNAAGKYVKKGGEHVSATCAASSARREAVSIEVEDKQDGRYEIRARPEEEGNYSLEIQVNGESLPQPVRFICREPTFDSNACHPNIRLSRDMRTAELCVKGCSSVLGNVGMFRGAHMWSVEIGPRSSYYVIGVIAKPVPHLNDTRHLSESFSTYNEDVFVSEDAMCASPLGPLQGNDTLRLRLDCGAHTLRITSLHSGKSATITNLADKEYFAYVLMYQKGNSVQLVY